MDKPKIIALICAWASEQWIEPLLKEVSEQYDEIMINISPHSESLRQFEDNTYDIVRKYMNVNKDIHYVNSESCSNHAVVKANILNKMLVESKCFNKEPNIWYAIRDVDEFYSQATYKQIKQVMKEDEYSAIRLNEKYFYINMQNYLEGNRCRFRKIVDKRQRFYPTQQWRFPVQEIFIKDAFMFHYGMLTDPNAKMTFWKSEYLGTEQDIKVEWMDKIYRNYDLKYEEYWIKENEKLCGLKSPWFEDNFKPDEYGKLIKYNGEHPYFIKHLEYIEDFRSNYDFH